MITYPDTGTHHWSLTHVDVSFDWMRMPSGNDIAVSACPAFPSSTWNTDAPPPYRPVAPHVREGRRSCLSRRTRHHRRADLPLRTRSPSVLVPTAALIPSLSGAAHRRTALPQARSLSGSRLSLGLPKRFQSFLCLHTHPDPLLRPAPLRCAMDLYSHIYPSLDLVLTPPLRVRPVSSCLHPHPDRDPRSSSSYGAPLLLLNHPSYRPSPHTPTPRSARAGPPRHSPSTQRTAARAPRRPSPSGATSPARAPPRNPRRPSCTVPHGQHHRPAYDVPRRVE
ncbi:hypothetical protein DFH08DRAFT_483279 [Mycena albidolilacea]|uniref:Uncharacterized protein n=1 Tax=Mycena albidolilacea TaxID=1033008 RepID=A0AAD7EC65_9AGAR|nr:hypothetical protein DFH08DRAFT_483279 [Mycena albidolilacea]